MIASRTDEVTLNPQFGRVGKRRESAQTATQKSVAKRRKHLPENKVGDIDG